MKRARSCIFAITVTLLACWPASAYAASDILGFLGELSGPGPFKIKGTGFESRAWCFFTAEAARDTTKQKVANCLLDDPDKTRATISYQLVWAGADQTQLFKDDPTDVRDVKEFTASVMFMYRTNHVIEVGGGLSWMRFKGQEGADPKANPAFSFWRAGFTPARVTFTPLGSIHGSERARAFARVIHLQFESVWIPGGFTGSDFGNSKTAYKADGEFQNRVQILIDGAAVIRGFLKK
jgi:hypothetical protein